MDLDLDKVKLFIYQLSTISQVLDLITVHLTYIRLFHVPLGLMSANPYTASPSVSPSIAA